MKKLTGIVFHDEFRTMDQASPRITLWQDGSIDKKAKPALLLIAEDGEQLPEVPEWIKCSDRLPEVKSEVLVWEKDGPSDPGAIWIATRLSDTAWELGDCEPPFIVEAARVTHWQPLPKAPNQ